MKTRIRRFVSAIAFGLASILPAWAGEDISFGAGKVSTFDYDGSSAVVVGVKGLTEDYFYDQDAYGATCFVDDRIVDAEKEDGSADDNWWCGQISLLNMFYMSGWAQTAGLTSKYATVDDALDYFRANPKLIRYATTPGNAETVTEGKYGFDTKTGKNKFINWFKDVTKTDLSKSTKTGTVGTKFPQTIQTLLGKGEYLMQISPVFFYPEANPRWADWCVTHSLVCCGYTLEPGLSVTKPEALTGLFIIDSDNDQDNQGGGRNAPNSIIYCPAYWDSESSCYVVCNLWGGDAYLYTDMDYTALKNNKPASVTVTFDGNGAEDYEKEVREYEAGEVYGELPYVYRDADKYTFLGWYTAKSKGTRVYEDSVVPSKSATVYALWEEIKPHTVKVVNGFAYDEDGNRKSSLSLYPSYEVAVEFDRDKIIDSKTGDEVGAFQSWDVSPADADLGEYFNPTDPETSILMPNAAVTLTANYISKVAAYLMFDAETIGAGDSASFYWSIDGGKTKMPCDGETMVPVAPGSVTVSFHAIDDETGKASSAWRIPGSRTYKFTSGATGAEQVYETARFVASADSKLVTFDANGGSVEPSSMYFIYGGEYYELPTPARSGYVFDGWWTAKDGGERVGEGDYVDFSMFGSKPTLYAQWLKAYTLTLKADGCPAELSVNSEYYEGPVSIMEGDHVSIWAPGDAYDAKEDEYVFSKWVLAKTADLGESFDAEANETSFVMPGADVTLTAKYRERYKKIPATISGGWTTDPLSGDYATSAKLIVGERADLVFDYSAICDKVGQEVGAFQRWVVEPADADLGEYFDPFSPETEFVVPDADKVTVKAQYVSPLAAYLTYGFGAQGYAEEEAWIYWSPDGGKTLIPSGRTYPLAAGAVTVTFYAKDEAGKDSVAWKVPPAQKMTIPARASHSEKVEDPATGKKVTVTVYDEDPFSLETTEWFVAANGAREVKFDANGGKCSVASRWYVDGEYGGNYYLLPCVEERKGYVFDGWWTSKDGCCGDGRVWEGDTVDFSVLGSKPTLYAHWLKAYALSLKGTDVYAEYEGMAYEKSVSVLQGGYVTLYAPSSYEDAKGNYYLFQCWTPSKSYDFGSEFSAGSCETALVMPAADVTLTAAYVKESEAAYLTMYATGEPVEADGFTIEPDYSKFLWSPDGKSWFLSGATALVKKGSYTVQWKSASDVWTAPTKKTSVKLAAGEEYSNEEDPAVFTFSPAASVTSVVYADGDWYESSAGGTVTMSPADGKLVSGKALTLTAKANKNCVFAGWQLEKAWDDYGFSPYATCEKATFSSLPTWYTDESDYKVHFQAVFRPLSDYTEENMYDLFGYVYSNCGGYEPSYDEDPLRGTLELTAAVGCQTSFNFRDGTAMTAWPLTFKQSGKLPAGLKFDADEGTLSGTPTASGDYNFTITATDPAGNTSALAVTLTVRTLSSSVAGEYRALMRDGETGAIAGILEMSVTSAGKASAKITTTAGGTVSLTPSLTWCADPDDPEAEGTFGIEYWKKSGGETSGSYVGFHASFGDEGYSGYANYESWTWKGGEETGSYMSGDLVCSDSSWFGDAAFAEAFLGKYHTLSLGCGEAEAEGYRTPTELMASGYLTVTTDKKGAVKVAGKLADGEKVSASTVLLPAADGSSASAILFVVPSSYKKKGYVALQLEFGADGTVASSFGSWVTPPLLDAIKDCDYCGEDELFLPGMLSLAANGGIYSKLDDLTGYYMSLGVSTGERTPELEYTYTDSEKQKCYEYAGPVLTEYALGEDMLTGGKGGKITVGKSPSPWKDSEGCWHYDETKEDKYGETQPITNPGGLTVSFKPATGVFSGKFNLFFDYEVPQYDKYGEEKEPKLEHKSVSCSYEGVLVGDSAYGVGSAQYSNKFTYQYWTLDKKGNEKLNTKTYTRKFALPVGWSVE